MGVFNPLPYAISLFMWFGIFFVLRGVSMLEILGIIVVLGVVTLFAAVKFTAHPTDIPTDFSVDE